MKYKVLVFPCGSEIGLEIHRSLSNSIHFDLYGASSVKSNHGKYVYKHYIEGLPQIDSTNFLEEINQIIEKNQIDFIIPAHDSVQLELSKHEHLLACKLISPSYETCQICRSKSATYLFFKGKIETPIMYSAPFKNIPFPLFLKPDIGEGSKGTVKIESIEELNFYLSQSSDDLLVLEYLPGKEYTIDCFTDRYGELKFVGGRERKRIKSGISVDSQVVQDMRFNEIAKIINSELCLRGAWFFQVKERSDGELVLMEIAPRIAGTMGLYRNRGVNFVALSLYDKLGLPTNILHQNFNLSMDRALINRYYLEINYEHLYIDLDDTIIVDGKVNMWVVSFIFQCLNKGIKVHLISKHRGDIYEYIQSFRLGFFDSIIWLEGTDQKFKYITQFPAIFIDDSYEERRQVHEKLGIPTFDLTSIEGLLDWRM